MCSCWDVGPSERSLGLDKVKAVEPPWWNCALMSIRRAQSKKTTVSEPQNGTSLDTETVGVFILTFPARKTMRNMFVV